MAVFKGSTRAVFLDRKTASGPIDQQIEEAMLFVKQNIRLGSRIDGVQREDIYELPIDSIREMVSNAVCHRSYAAPGSIQLALFDNRLEVTSPGRIASDLTIEQMIGGNSRVRNVAIAAAFHYMRIIEKWGTGIPRIFEDARTYGLGEPELRDFGTSFRISLRRKPFETDLFGVISPAVRGGESGGLDEPACRHAIGWATIETRCAQRGYNASTMTKLKRVYDAAAPDRPFSAATLRALLGCADSTARELISKLKSIEAVVPVIGSGKGVYRFVGADEQSGHSPAGRNLPRNL